MYIAGPNILVKSPFSNVSDLYEQSFSNVLIVQEGRATQGGFDTMSALTLYTGRDVTLRFKLVKADRSGVYSAYSLVDVDTVQLSLNSKSGYSSSEDDRVTATWEFSVESPASLGLAYFDVEADNVPEADAYWGELQLVRGDRLYSFAYINVEVKDRLSQFA